MMTLPLVAPFVYPYEFWTYKTPSIEEGLAYALQTGTPCLHVKDQLVATVRNPIEAAIHIATVGMDNALAHHINQALDESLEYKLWRSAMPSRTPKELSDYQKRYPHCDLEAVNIKINEYGRLLPEGQVLFHGGTWPAQEYFRFFRVSRG